MDGLPGSFGGIIRALDGSSHDDGFMPSYGLHDHRSPFIDSDDDDDYDETIRDMYGRNCETSSDGSNYEYSDEEEDVGRRSAQMMHFRGEPTEINHHHDNAGDVDEDLDEVPDWFLWQHIQHSKILVLPLVTGAPLVMLLGGEMLLTVIALSALVAHLMNEAGAAKNTTHCCVLAIVCAVIMVTYNIIPLIIWRSPWYIVLLAMAVIYIMLTGSWILLMLKHFCGIDPLLNLYLEGLLFTAYPSASIILTTWTLGMLIGRHVAPYVLLVTGFFFFRLFLRPTHSSFVKVDCSTGPQKMIVDPWQSVIMTFWLMLAPSVVYMGMTTYNDASFPMMLSVFMNFISILAASIFVSTFLHMDPIIQCLEIPLEMIVTVRKVVVIATILSWTLSFCFHGYHPILLWPLMFLCAWSGLGLALSKVHKHQKFDGVVFTVTLLILTAVLLIEMPWSHESPGNNNVWSNDIVYITILTHAIVCMLVICSSKYVSTELFSCLVLLHSLVFSPQMVLLFQSHMASVTTVIFSHIFCAYVIIRMYHVNKILWLHATLTIATHMTSVFITMATIYIPSSQTWTVFLVKSVTLYALVAILVHILVMEKDQFVDIILMETNKFIDIAKFTRYMCVTGTLSIIYVWLEENLLSLLSHSDQESHFLLALGVCFILTSIPAIKLALYHRTAHDRTRIFGLGLLGVGLVLVILQPDITPHLFDVMKLLLVLSVLCGGALVLLVYRIRSTVVLYLLCIITGSSLGIVIYSVAFPGQTTSGFVILLYSIQVTLWLAMAVNCLRHNIKSDRHLFIMSVSAKMLAVVMVLSDLLSRGAVLTEATPVRVCATATFLVIAALIKSQSLIQLPQVSRDVAHVSRLPVVGNMAAVMCLFLLLSFTPAVLLPADLWMLASTSVLFFLRQDDNMMILRHLNHKNHSTPIIAATLCILTTSISYQSPLLLPHTSHLNTFCATLELICLLLTTPVLVTFTLVLWYDCFQTVGWYKAHSQALSVLYFTPFFFCFLLAPIATTYHSWLYALVGIATGTYLWQSKIPLSLL